MKITIAGLGGTGTSTVAKLLGEKLGFDVMSGGNIFREMAKELGMSVYEFDEYVKTHPEYDERLDSRQKEYGETHNDFVFESRIGWYFIPDAFKIKLVCDLDERLRRIQEREGGDLEKLKEKTLAREATYTPRYKVLYGIDNWQADGHFDMIIDATVDTPEEIVAKILHRLNNISDMDFVFLGIQGSGKGTQARKLAEEFGYGVFEMGQAFRDLMKTTEPLAEEVRGIINAGHLVDNERVMKVFRDAMDKLAKKGMPEKMIFDGIPRRIGQDDLFEDWMHEKGREFRVVNIIISEEEALNRLVRRKICTGCGKPFTFAYESDVCDVCGGSVEVREDESAESIKQRITEFNELTLPMLERYRERGLLIDIDGEQTPDEVFAELKDKLAEFLNS